MRKRWLILGGTVLVAGALVVTAVTGNRSTASPFQRLLGAIIVESGAQAQTDIAFGPHARHRLDVYRPAAGGANADNAKDSSKPVIVFLYGGGWRSGERDTYRFLGAALAKRGFTTVIPDYRVYPQVKFPRFIEDAALAYHWVAEAAERGELPGGGIVLAGHSAGAYLAAMLIADRTYLDDVSKALPRPAGLIGLAGPYAFDPVTWHSTAEIFSTAPSSDAARPVAHVQKAGRRPLPPALFIHGLADTTVKPWNSQEMAAAWKVTGSPVRLLELDGIGHIAVMSAISWPLRWRAPVLEEIIEFVEILPTR